MAHRRWAKRSSPSAPLEQSGRFDRAWRMLAATYVHAIRLPANVIDLASRRPRH